MTGERGERVAAIPPHFSDSLVPEPPIFPDPAWKKPAQRLPMNQTLAPRDLALCGPLSQVLAHAPGELLRAEERPPKLPPRRTGPDSFTDEFGVAGG